MARIERLTSGKYRIRWTDPWGKRTSKSFLTAADAKAHYRKVLGDMARGEYIDPRRSRTTVAVWADDWLAGARNLSRGGHDTYRRDLDRYILPALGKLPLGKVRSTDIDRYLSEKGAGHLSSRAIPVLESRGAGMRDDNSGLAPSTIHRHYRTLHRMFAVAVERGLLARNPCEHVQPRRDAEPSGELGLGYAVDLEFVEQSLTEVHRPAL